MIYSIVSAVLSFAALAVVVVLLLRSRNPGGDLGERLERLERTLRDEAARGRDEAGTQARQGREEVTGLIRAFQDGLTASAEKHHTELRLLVEQKLAEFRADQATQGRNLREEVIGGLKQLGETLGATLKDRLDANARVLAELTQKLEAGQESLRVQTEQKLAEFRADQATQGRNLREEVIGGLKQLGETLGATLKDRLDANARVLAELTQKLEAGQESLRVQTEQKLAEFRADQATQGRNLREEVIGGLKQLGETLGNTLKDRLEANARVLAELGQKHEAGQQSLRKSVEERLDTLRGENTAKLEQMRQTVDEKLQGTLEKRLGESFKLVSDRLEQVHKGLGEMQSLANGVGDLKRVLTNVKTRGTWGEVQLGNLLEQIFTADQFTREATCRQGSGERVDFAIRLPGKGDGEPEVLLPIDSKFPNEDYERLQMAVEAADPEAVEAAGKALEMRVRAFARDIRDKYINPPHTTDFAILFMPTEGLYAEVLRRPGLIDLVQHDFKVMMAGPTTLGAILNALQMGFKTLAIEQRSSEVWEILGAVKTEFGKYGDVLDKVQKKLQEASKTIDDVAVRKRAIDRRLRAVESLPEAGVQTLLGLNAAAIEDGGEDEAEVG
ncbi:DNA recombination protein RmuC homolog (modular protein) [Candidatus Terasakiella magnetica]|nr:DNA recombination protein RmuC homolog (modular protein) [Candidatus Terasakiella magnetica]